MKLRKVEKLAQTYYWQKQYLMLSFVFYRVALPPRPRDADLGQG